MRRVLWWMCILCSMLLVAETLNAQAIVKGSVQWNLEGAGDWNADASWNEGVPGEGDVASVKNGGTAQIGGAVPTVDAVSVVDGAVEINAGGSIETAQAVVGGNGSLHIVGGSLTAGSLANAGALHIGAGSTIAVSGGFASSGFLGLDAGGADAYSMITVGAGADITGSSIDLVSLPAGGALAVGSSFPFLTSASLAGQPASITVGGAAPDLARGLSLQVATDAGVSSVAVGSQPIAVVNRGSGNITVENAAGGTLQVKGYTIASGNELLSVEGFSGLGDGWTSASPSSSQLTELNLSGVGELPVGSSADLGNAWGGTRVSPREEDVEFNVLLADGRTIQGAVEYVGAANDLVLNVDPATGSATLQNLSASIGDLNVSGFTISSASGSLSVEGFSGIAGDEWTKAGLSANSLSQFSLESSQLFSNGTMVDLGTLFTPDSAQDLSLSFGIVGSDKAQPGTVEYGAGGPGPDPTSCEAIAAMRIPGDADGDGEVAFLDFLALANNFGTDAGYEGGDFDCNREVAFLDFLILANNFGATASASAAAVPEPSMGVLAVLGVLGLFQFRRSRKMHKVLGIALVATFAATATTETFAQELDQRFIQIHPDGPNNQINSTEEAAAIFNGTALDVVIDQDLTGTLFTADLGGGAGSFSNDQSPYLNPDAVEDFGTHISGTYTIPAGEWTVACGSDDGCFINLPGISFISTFNEVAGPNTPLIDGDGMAFFNGTRGHAWTGGTFITEEPVTTGLEGLFFERGGGDSFELAYVDAIYDPALDGDFNAYMAGGIELDPGDANGGFGDWELTGDPFMAVSGDPNDLNGDGAVNQDDFTVMADNWGNPYDFDDFFAFATAFNAPAGAAVSSIPEPAGISLLALGLVSVLSIRRRPRH